jgi:dimethylamine corrinoid protein
MEKTMSDLKEQLFEDLYTGVAEMDEERVITASRAIIENNIDAYEAIEKGLSKGMERAGQLFEEEEYFVPELLICSDAMYVGLDILTPHIKIAAGVGKKKIVIGVIEGDTHDIGKNLVKIMLETSGFELIDLGRDIPARTFVEKAKETGAEVIAISTLMTTTMRGMAEVVKVLNNEGIRNHFKVVVGGEPISQAFADKIGADGYAANARSAVRLIKSITRGEA